MTNLHDEIAKVAYELYEESGKINGNDLFNWLEAERLVESWYKGQQEGQKLKAAMRKTTSQEDSGDRRSTVVQTEAQAYLKGRPRENRKKQTG